MSDCVCRIEKLVNGYEVYLLDPKIAKANTEKDDDDKQPYRDPMRGYMFKTVGEVLKFLRDNLDKVEMPDDYESSFKVAAKDMGD